MACKLDIIIPQRPRKPYNPLWDELFEIKMLWLHSRSVEYVREYGVRQSDVEAFNRGAEQEEIHTEMSINDMYEKWRRGVTIKVIHYEDTAKIYRIIHRHLILWAEYMSGPALNNGGAPLEDLVRLDDFASIVYDKAVHVFNAEERHIALSSNFANVQQFNFQNILKRQHGSEERVTEKVMADGSEVITIRPKERALEDAKPKNYGPRASMKDIFTEALQNMHGWRGDTHG